MALQHALRADEQQRVVERPGRSASRSLTPMAHGCRARAQAATACRRAGRALDRLGPHALPELVDAARRRPRPWPRRWTGTARRSLGQHDQPRSVGAPRRRSGRSALSTVALASRITGVAWTAATRTVSNVVMAGEHTRPSGAAGAGLARLDLGDRVLLGVGHPQAAEAELDVVGPLADAVDRLADLLLAVQVEAPDLVLERVADPGGARRPRTRSRPSTGTGCRA